MQSTDESSRRRKELLNLVMVVLFIGLISNIVASYLATDFLKTVVLGLSVGVWLIIIFILLFFVSSYLLVLNPREVTQTAIYTNLPVDRINNRIHLSIHAPVGVQYAELIWRSLLKDQSPLAKVILTKLHDSSGDAPTLDFVEYLIFLMLSGFEPLWASAKIDSYGYPTGWIHRLGDEPRFSPSTIYHIQEKEVESESGIEYRNLKPIIEKNELVKHFLGSTSLEHVYTPRNWLIFLPKGTQISVEYQEHARKVLLSNCYSTISLTIAVHGVSSGLPYGMKIKETNYDEKRFFTSDFRIDFKASFSRLLPINPHSDDYHNWVRLVRQKMIANFALDRTGVIREIE